MRIRGRGHKLRGRWPLPLAAALGAGAVILPAVASSETTSTIEAVNEGGLYGEKHLWKPRTATVLAGGGVNFSNPSNVPHGVEWRPGNPAMPSCGAGVPVGTSPAASGTNWSGTCTFSQPGTYTFWCTVHRSEMSGTITVNANGTITTGSPSPSVGSTPSSGPSGNGQQGSPESASGAGGTSPLAGSAASAVRLASTQHGGSVRGSVEVSAAGAGGRLAVELLAKSAALANAGHGARVRVGRLVLSHLRAGEVSFTVPLGSRARSALRRRHRLALTARLQIQAPGGSPLTITRAVTLHL
jgi:plastocyanin